MMNVFKKAFLLFCVALTLSSCALYRERAEVQDLADRIWAFSQTHPDGFTLVCDFGGETIQLKL